MLGQDDRPVLNLCGGETVEPGQIGGEVIVWLPAKLLEHRDE